MKCSVTIDVGEGVDPFSTNTTRSPRAKLRAFQKLLKQVTGGGLSSRATTRPTVRISTAAGAGTVTWANTAASGSAVVLNGVSISGTQLAARAKATLVSAAAADALTVAGVAFVAAQLNARAKATLVTPVVGNVLTLAATALTAAQVNARAVVTFTGAPTAAQTITIGATPFVATAGAVTPGDATFSIDTDDTARATSLAAQINAHVVTAALVGATSALGVVKLRAATAGTAGNAIALAETCTNVALTAAGGGALAGAFLEGGIAQTTIIWDYGDTDTQAATALAAVINANATTGALVGATSALGVVKMRAILAGTAGNAIALTKTGSPITLAATGGGALAGAFLEGGVAQGAATWDYGDTDTQGAAALAAVINTSVNASISGIVSATSALGVVTVKAVTEGTAGNAITITDTGTTITILAIGGGADTGVLQGGAAYSGNQFDGIYAGGSVAKVAASLASAINRSATAGILNVVTATSAAGVTTITAADDGVGGNDITFTVSGTGPTASGSGKLAGGTSTLLTF